MYLVRAVLSGASSLMLASTGGCMYIKQEPQRHALAAGTSNPEQGLGFVLPERAWPNLSPIGLPTFVEESSQVFKADVPIPEHGGRTSTVEFRVNTIRHAGAMGPGWVQWFNFRAGDEPLISPERPTSFDVFFWNSTDVAPEGMVNGCIAGLASDPNLAARRAWIDASKQLRIKYEITLPQTRPIRGLILYGGSLAPQYERPVINELVRRGWAIVFCSSGSMSIDRLLTEVIHIYNGGDAALNEYARLAALECDKVLAGYAYGWEVALEIVDRYYPEIPSHPCVLAGFSFGAIMTPPSAARLGDKVDAAVLVGGGTNLLGIVAETPIFHLPIRVQDTPVPGQTRRPTSNELERLTSLYLLHSRLDGHYTARALANKPVLIVHAELDGWVPARYGRDLWEQAGRPERWRGPFGHMLMFYFLGRQAVPIADWIDRATSDLRPSGARP